MVIFSLLRDTSVVLTVDLSAPNDIWVTMEVLLSYLTNRVEICLTEAARRDSQLWDKVKANTRERLGGDHPVSYLDSFLPCPVYACYCNQLNSITISIN